jgi:heat shock protein HslJ
MRRLVLLLVGLLALAACGSEANAGSVGAEGEWQLRSGTADGAALPQPPGTRATLEFAGGEARGTAFCNLWFATVRVDGTALSLDGIGQTERGCPMEVMAADSAYLGALAAVEEMGVEGEELVLTGDGVELRFEPVPAVPDSTLEGTRWVLGSLVDGDMATSVLGDPSLELFLDGTLAASTGCRTVGGSWRSDGDSVVAEPDHEDVGCLPPDDRQDQHVLAVQDEHVLAVLAAAPVATIDGDRLTLTAADGRGLVYRAEG